MFLCVALISFNVCSVLLDASFMSSCCQFSVPLFFLSLIGFRCFCYPWLPSVSLCVHIAFVRSPFCFPSLTCLSRCSCLEFFFVFSFFFFWAFSFSLNKRLHLLYLISLWFWIWIFSTKPWRSNISFQHLAFIYSSEKWLPQISCKSLSAKLLALYS